MHPYLMEPDFTANQSHGNAPFAADGQFPSRDGDERRSQTAGIPLGPPPGGPMGQGGSWPPQQFHPSFAPNMPQQFQNMPPNPAWQQQQAAQRQASEDGGPSRWPPPDDRQGFNGAQGYPTPELIWQMQQMQQAMASAAAMQQFAGHPGQSWQHLAQFAKSSTVVDYSLVEALRARVKNKRSVRAAIESLHMVNGFPADAWKDYYLENRDSIDAQVQPAKPKENGVNGHSAVKLTKSASSASVKAPAAASKQKAAAPAKKETTVKRPKLVARSPSAVTISESESEAESESDFQTSRARAKRKRAASPPKVRVKREESPISLSYLSTTTRSAGAATSRRATLNSIVSQYDTKPEDWMIEVPSRSPTPPPAPRIPANRGNRRNANKFTDEDRQYCIKFLTYELHKDPDLSKGDLGDKIGAKAPHHPARSWQSFFNRDDLIEKIRKSVPTTDEDAEGSTAE